MNYISFCSIISWITSCSGNRYYCWLCVSCDNHSLSSFWVFLSLASGNFLIIMSCSVPRWVMWGPSADLSMEHSLNSSSWSFQIPSSDTSIQSNCWAPSLSQSHAAAQKVSRKSAPGGCGLVSFASLLSCQHLKSCRFIHFIQFLVVFRKKVNLARYSILTGSENHKACSLNT